MKRAFTLVELLIVVVILAILLGMVVRLSTTGTDTEKRAKTIMRLQKLENCLSGYYAAFGNYPPVQLHGSRNLYYEVKNGVQQVKDNPQTGELVWERVEAACRSQPMSMDFPYAPDMFDYVRETSEILKQRYEAGEEGFDNPDLAKVFDALEQVSHLSGKRDQPDWTVTQLFRFGLMSFLLPRYIVMMRHGSDSEGNGGGLGHNGTSAYQFRQWSDNNEVPSRFDTGMSYGEDWPSAAQAMMGGSGDRWQVALIPSQAVTARWMPNLAGILSCESPPPMLYGVNVQGDGIGNVCPDNPRPRLYSYSESQGGESDEKYALDCITCRDGWGNEFYYYSKPPYQNYRLWSAGPNGLTFAPWVSDDELKDSKMQTMRVGNGNQVKVATAIADDIVHMKN